MSSGGLIFAPDGFERMPGDPEPPGPMPGPGSPSPIPGPPLFPSAPLRSALDGSPIDAGSIWITGESNATVIAIGSFGSGSDFGGMNVRGPVGGGAPLRAGSSVRLLPPDRSGASR